MCLIMDTIFTCEKASFNRVKMSNDYRLGLSLLPRLCFVIFCYMLFYCQFLQTRKLVKFATLSEWQIKTWVLYNDYIQNV